MTDRNQDNPIRRETRTSRRGFFQRAGLAAAGAVAANTVDLDGLKMGVQLLNSGLSIATDLRTRRIAAAQCAPQSTDGKDPLCVEAGSDVFGQSYIGGFYFDDRDGDREFTSGIDHPVQGVKDRRILVEVIRAKGSGDYIQLNPESRKVEGDQVSYEDVKAGKNSGTRFVERWTIFQLPNDGGDGLGTDLRTGNRRLILAASAGDLVDKVWAPVDDGKRAERHECSGNCQWNCVVFLQFSRLAKNAKVNLNDAVVQNDAIHRDPTKGDVRSSFTDYAWLWENRDLSEAHVDYSAINTPLTPELRKNEGVVQSFVSVPAKLMPYNNLSR